MLLSNRFQFLFVHIAKTGGTSIRSVLGRHDWKDPYSAAAFLCHRISHLCGHRIGTKLPRHAAIVGAQEMLSPARFDAFYKFAFVRNPWDRHVSAYHHFLREQPQVLAAQRIGSFQDFSRWLLEESQGYRGPKHVLVASLRRLQIAHLVNHEGAIVVDFVGRYEQLEEDFHQICRRVGWPVATLPHRRRAGDRRDYRTYYTDAIADQVGQAFGQEAVTFGYRFDPVAIEPDTPTQRNETYTAKAA